MVEKIIEDYITQWSASETESMKKLHDYTLDYGHGSHMISGELQGAFLRAMSMLKQPKNILEIGCYTGYSALCLAQGLQEDGRLITIDPDDRHEEFMKAVWQEDEQGKKIEYIKGDAREILPELDMEFDIVFIDANKKAYEDYFEMVLPKMRKGAFILADNILFRKEPMLPEEEQSKTGRYMDLFNQKVANDSRVLQVVLPLRDGISIIVKQ